MERTLFCIVILSITNYQATSMTAPRTRTINDFIVKESLPAGQLQFLGFREPCGAENGFLCDSEKFLVCQEMSCQCRHNYQEYNFEAMRCTERRLDNIKKPGASEDRMNPEQFGESTLRTACETTGMCEADSITDFEFIIVAAIVFLVALLVLWCWVGYWQSNIVSPERMLHDTPNPSNHEQENCSKNLYRYAASSLQTNDGEVFHVVYM